MKFVSRQAHLRLMCFIHVSTFNNLTSLYLYLIRPKNSQALKKVVKC